MTSDGQHFLKTWPDYFNAVMNGRKTFEVRRNDRNFAVDDCLILQEWDPKTGDYTGAEIVRHIGYILQGPGFGIEDGFCVMALENLE